MIDLDLPQDYADFLHAFVAAGVEFLLIGGWAVAVHGHGRATDAEGGTGDSSSSVTADSTGVTPTTDDPSVADGTADTSAGPTGPSTATESSGEGETTAGVEDAPPVIEAFSVQGSQAPPEILLAEMVELQATVTDDVGVAWVEFFDGGELLGVDESSPFRLEFLVTSADNGGHSYTAVAYDTVDQMAEAGPIAMSVGIDGGGGAGAAGGDLGDLIRPRLQSTLPAGQRTPRHTGRSDNL